MFKYYKLYYVRYYFTLESILELYQHCISPMLAWKQLQSDSLQGTGHESYISAQQLATSNRYPYSSYINLSFTLGQELWIPIIPHSDACFSVVVSSVPTGPMCLEAKHTASWNTYKEETKTIKLWFGFCGLTCTTQSHLPLCGASMLQRTVPHSST